MPFCFGHIKSAEQFLFRNFSEQTSQILNLSELKNNNLQVLFYSQKTATEEVMSILNEEHRFTPVKALEEINLTGDEVCQLTASQAKEHFLPIQEAWLIQNNLILLQELFPTLNHLRRLWPNDRGSFFEELWYILRSNLGPKSLQLIFNDVKKTEKQNDKGRLVRVRISGSRLPEPLTGTSLEDKLLQHYEKDFNSHFEIIEYNKDNGEMVITATINKSPILIIAEIYQFTTLQKVLLGALFDGLNFIATKSR